MKSSREFLLRILETRIQNEMGFLAQNASAEKQDQGRRGSIVVRRKATPVFFFSSLHRGRRRSCVNLASEETMDVLDDGSYNLLYDVLLETDLLKFQNELASKLQITKIEHFEHVKESELKVSVKFFFSI